MTDAPRETSAAARGGALRALTDPLVLVCAAYALLVAWQRQPRFFNAEPVIELYRFLNPHFLPKDFYANTLGGYDYQHFFTLLNGALVRLIGMSPDVELSVIAYISVVGAAVAVGYAVYLLTGRSARAAAVSAVFTGATLFALGGLGPYLPFARPWAMAQPVVVAAMALTAVRRPVAAAILMGVASLIHPLVGAVMGTLCIAAAWLDHVAAQSGQSFARRFLPGNVLIAGLILVVFLSPNIVFFIKSMAAFRMPDREFAEVTIFYRHPQHYLVHFWLRHEVVNFAFGMLAIAAALFHAEVRAMVTRPLALIAAAIVAMMVVGYVLIEVIPTRLGASLMAYRFSINLHYLLVLMAGCFAWTRCRTDSGLRDRVWAYLMVVAFLGLARSYAVFAVFLVSLPAFRSEPRRNLAIAAATAAALVAAIAVEALWRGDMSWGHLGAAILLVAAMEATWRMPRRVLAPAAAVGVAALFVLGAQDTVLAPRITAAHEAKDYDIARALGRLTPPDALVVEPPGLEVIRTVGKRALVVGYEFPFLDQYVAGWWQRARTVWGTKPLFYADAIARYRHEADARLRAARDRFGATHAVLFSETPTSFPTLYDNGKYKIVRLQ